MASTPICRCRVLYLGSAVPHITKDGLHGIQEPLRELYPEEGVFGAKGIDSWLSVWSNGLVLENIDEKHKRVTRFFPIESLHYCAAVRHVTIPGTDGGTGGGGGGSDSRVLERFLPLDSPFARIPSANNPPLFACILRRTSGIKVLECHAFVSKKEMAANALVRCCFHAYADNMYVKHLETATGGAGGSIYGSVVAPGAGANHRRSPPANGNGLLPVNPIQKVEQWRTYVQNNNNSSGKDGGDSDTSQDNGELVSIYDGDENHKVWAGGFLAQGVVANGDGSGSDQQSIYADYVSTIRSVKSMNGTGTQRSNRPRQLASPSSPPPPPPVASNSEQRLSSSSSVLPAVHQMNGKSPKIKDAKNRSKSMTMLNGNGYQNGHHHGPPQQLPLPMRRFPGPPPMSAAEFRPGWPPRMLGPPPPPGHCAPLPPRMLHYPPPTALIKGGRPVPIGAFPLPPHHMPPGGVMRRGVAAEEPIYLPSARPMSPIASYQPGAFPYEQYYLNHHGGGGGGHHMPPPPPPPHLIHPSNGHHPHPPPGAKLSKYKKKKDKNQQNSSDSDSKFNTGIYRKKGHLNERAFSYSIRQEHRSRSHSSLTTLSFAGPVSPTPSSAAPNGNASVPNGNGIQMDGAGGMTNGHHDGGSTKYGAANGGTQVNGRAKKQGGNSPGPSLAGSVASAVMRRGGKKGNHINNNHQNNSNTSASSINNMLNDLSLSDGEIEDIGSNMANSASRKRNMAVNHI